MTKAMGWRGAVFVRESSKLKCQEDEFAEDYTIFLGRGALSRLKYSMSVVADRGLRPSQFTSARLKRADVLYLETRSQRFELSYQGEGPPRIAGNGSGKFQGGVGNGALAEKKAEQDAHGREEERGKVGGSEAVGDKNGGREQEREGEGEAHTGEGRDKEGEKGTEGGKEKKEQNSHSRDKETERHGAEKSGGNHHHHHHHHEKALTHAHGHGHGQNHGASKEGSHGRGETTELYKWARCGSILSLAAMRAKGCPLPADSVEVLEDGISWEEIQWSPTSVFVRGREYELARAHFMPRRGPSEH